MQVIAGCFGFIILVVLLILLYNWVVGNLFLSFLILFGIILISILYSNYQKKHKQPDELESTLEKIHEKLKEIYIEPHEEILSFDFKHMLFWDKKNKQTVIVTSSKNDLRIYADASVYVFDTESVDSVDIVESTFYETTNKKPNQERIPTAMGIDLVIKTFNDDKKEKTTICFLNEKAKSKKGEETYDTAYAQAVYWKNLITGTKRNKRGTLLSEKKGTLSGKFIADEILKLDELRKKGILTHDEFEIQKRKLLQDE